MPVSGTNGHRLHGRYCLVASLCRRARRGGHAPSFRGVSSVGGPEMLVLSRVSSKDLKDAVGEPVLPHELPDIFLTIEFWLLYLVLNNAAEK